MKYGHLFSISLKHEYYKSGLCPDFTVSPQQYTEAMREKDIEALIGGKAEVPKEKLAEILMRRDTLTLLKNHRCVVKPKPNGIKIFAPTDDGITPLFPFAKNTQFSFDLRLKNPEFDLFTETGKDELPVGKGFTITYPKYLEKNEQKKFPSGVFASLTFQQDFNVMDEQTPLDFELKFLSKSLRWVYYLVTDPSVGNFSITYGGAEVPSLTWDTLTPHSTDTIDTMLQAQYPLKQRVRFVSNKAVRHKESGLKNIRLAFGQHPIFDNLPSPSLRNFYQTSVDTTSGQTDAIYAIVKCVTNTTLTKV